MKNLNTRHYCVLICVVLFTILLLGCAPEDPETHVHIRIKNLSDYNLEEINLGHGRQNGADYSTSYLRRSPLEPNTYTQYKALLPNTANYGAAALRTTAHSRPNVHFTGHIHFGPANPATREPMEAGKHYTYEFDLAQNPRHEDRFDVIYFNIVEDPPPSDN